MPGMIGPLVQLSSRPDLEVTRMADALSDVLRAGSILPVRIHSVECPCLHCAGASPNLRLNARLNASSDS